MRIEEFTQQGFEECPPELIPALRTPMNQESNLFVREIYRERDNLKHYLVIEENGSESKLKVLHAAKNAGWIEPIMNLNIE